MVKEVGVPSQLTVMFRGHAFQVSILWEPPVLLSPLLLRFWYETDFMYGVSREQQEAILVLFHFPIYRWCPFNK